MMRVELINDGPVTFLLENAPDKGGRGGQKVIAGITRCSVSLHSRNSRKSSTWKHIAIDRSSCSAGLDVGTQSLRAALVDLEGRTVAFGIAPIETTYPHPTWAERAAAIIVVGGGAGRRSSELAEGDARAELVIGVILDCTCVHRGGD